jgi:hypothetical protein
MSRCDQVAAQVEEVLDGGVDADESLRKECDQEGLGESCFLLGVRFDYGDGAD